jgi:hypothetical protein
LGTTFVEQDVGQAGCVVFGESEWHVGAGDELGSMRVIEVLPLVGCDVHQHSVVLMHAVVRRNRAVEQDNGRQVDDGAGHGEL